MSCIFYITTISCIYTWEYSVITLPGGGAAMAIRTRSRRGRSSASNHRTEPLEPRLLLASFRGVSLQDEFDVLGSGPTTSPCPDTMGAVGPNHFLEEIKGAVAVFDKNTGARLSMVSLANFFTVTIDGT